MVRQYGLDGGYILSTNGKSGPDYYKTALRFRFRAYYCSTGREFTQKVISVDSHIL